MHADVRSHSSSTRSPTGRASPGSKRPHRHVPNVVPRWCSTTSRSGISPSCRDRTVIEQFAHFVQGIVSDLGYPGLFVLIMLESTLIPIPSELVMPFAGALAASGE